MADTANKLVQIQPAKDLRFEHSTNLRDHFPFSEVRGNQNPALDKLAAWMQDSTKKFFILEGPTGFGKSPVDIACASAAKTLPGFGQFEPGAYILTPQKSLAEQYMKDFKPNGLVELKGRANYRCAKWSERTGEEVDCETGADLNESSGLDERCDNCGYKAAKNEFIANPFGTTNFAYYLNETNHAGQLANRNLLILDEGHNTEDQILSLTDTIISQRDCDKYGAGTLPKFEEGDNAKVLEWLDSTLMGAVTRYSNALAKKLKDARDEDRVTVIRKIKSVERFISRINMFRNAADTAEWFAWSDWSEISKGRFVGTGDLYIKPLTARLFADNLLFSKAQKVLITSATILDFTTFMRNLGISREDCVTLAVNSEFPVQNRPIMYTPVGSMSSKFNPKAGKKNKDITLPLMAQRVEELLTRFMAKKGIIHTNSYEINKYIVNYLMNTSHASRIITHDSSKGAREAAIQRHLDSPEPTVLISPSMTEGLDLKDDASRFQIICKVPYPALTPYVRARMRMKDGDSWYQWQTSLKLVQATGRSVRHKEDKAVTFILDADFAQFIMKNNRVLPKYWTDSIVWG